MQPNRIDIVFANSQECITLNQTTDNFNLCISDIVSERYITTKENGYRNDWFRAKNIWLHVEGEKAEELIDMTFGDYIHLIVVSDALNPNNCESYCVDREIGTAILCNHKGCNPVKTNKLQVRLRGEDNSKLDVFIGREASIQYEDYWLKREGY